MGTIILGETLYETDEKYGGQYFEIVKLYNLPAFLSTIFMYVGLDLYVYTSAEIYTQICAGVANVITLMYLYVTLNRAKKGMIIRKQFN